LTVTQHYALVDAGSKKKKTSPSHHLSMDFQHQRQKNFFEGQPLPTRPSPSGPKKNFPRHRHHQRLKKFFSEVDSTQRGRRRLGRKKYFFTTTSTTTICQPTSTSIG
jgi:hypothetical protein